MSTMQRVSSIVSGAMGDTLSNIKTWSTIAYNVLEHSLVGDGVTDDTAALQALINKAIAAGRKTILFPHTETGGKYFVTALTNVDKVDFVGDNSSFVGGYTGTIGDLGGFAALEDKVAADFDSRGVSPVTFGVVGDGVADDTINLQAAFDFALANNMPIILNDVYAVTGVTISENALISGFAKFIPLNDNQPHVVKIAGRVEWRGKLHVDGLNKALNGIVSSAFINSHVADIRVENCKVWGHVFDTVGNNNGVQVDKFRGAYNGTKHTSNYTVAISAGGLKTLTLTTPMLAEYFIKPYDILFVYSAGRPYLVKKVNSPTEIEVYHIGGAVASTGSVDIFIGGALNIPGYGDNGVGNWGVVDVFGNRGIGVNMSALYGHTFGRLVAQGNGVGVSCTDISLGVDFQTPYFELNAVDIVIGTYMHGRMSNPTIDYNKVFNIVNKNTYGFDLNYQLDITSPTKRPNMSNEIPIDNPNNITIIPSNHYSYYYNENQTARTFTIKNDVVYKNTLSNYIHLTVQTAVGMMVTFQLANANGETVEGGASYIVGVFGKAHFELVCISGNWRVVTLTEQMKRTSPPAVGNYGVGHVIFNSAPTAGGFVGWVCTVAGTPGTWKTFGAITA